ncbi:catechol 2,3-dioxygenase-like lactoylglutathione lyase family enzyme [Deinobacterium chartae]|uniref:Catechol 2,3-dioxygenase-like lactoylglutathione lyase family enzyme n=1 Tax=Deinobacterium chartae TaxID=521158 RepID=A0A841HZH9_9DEIO|nr:VOC family protein [Deinobacterium chartae]MBB6098353.1 catechol 2,3-dioxygenase-like lactoylglutathione lyase family enzyme [Deinobacterium chartae]
MDVLETCLYVDDLEAAEAFYVGLLGFELHSRKEGRHLFLRAGNTMLLLFDPQASALPGELPPHAARPGGHVCFALEPRETDLWEARLLVAGLEVTRYRWGERGESLYFHDPAGNLLELAPRAIWGL